ncbi:MAG: pseudouridine synthase [Rikenellaceae bacterium]
MSCSKLHTFDVDVSDISLPERFTYPFNYTPHPLAVLAAEQIKRYLLTREDWAKEIGGGKMFGLLIVEAPSGDVGFLAGFSGMVGGGFNHDYFVPPIYDLQSPGSYFKGVEAEISAFNSKIKELEDSEDLRCAKRSLADVERVSALKLERAKSSMKRQKIERDRLRGEGADCGALIAQSQFQKAEYKRLQRDLEAAISEARSKLDIYNSQISLLKSERKRASAELQNWLFEQFVLLNARGERLSIARLFAERAERVPPAGSGECAAPKLLQYAFQHSLHPLAMAEFWWGDAPSSQVRVHGNYYGACKSKCEPILSFMLQGLVVEDNPLKGLGDGVRELEILYQDSSLMVVNKPEGLLSARGKSSEVSVESLAQRLNPEARVVHRLDQATSGLLIIALDLDTYISMQRAFSRREIIKRYCAILSGELHCASGTIDLPLLPDESDRPRQMVDQERGKSAVTHFELIERKQGRSRLYLYPKTGRTHQLRLHSAHSLGLGMPIVGDALYGQKADRLYLHADLLIFRHPISGESIEISSPAPF